MSLLLKKFNKGQLQYLQKTNLQANQLDSIDSYPETPIVHQQLTLSQVAQILCISVGTARNILSAGGDFPPNFRAGRRRLFCPIELQEWLNKKKTET